MAGYIRQSSFVDGDTITAALFNDEYNQLVNAFSNTNGHKHDGTTAEGPVIGLIGDAGETSPNNKVLIDTTNNYIEFYIEVASAPVQQLYIADGAIVPVTDNDIDLGTSSLEFKNLYLDGIAKIDTLTVDEAATIGTTLGVTGATTLSSTLGVTGATTLSSTLAVTGATTLSSTLAVTGTSTLTGNVTTTNNLSVGGNLTVTGNATISGNLTFGDADTDTITIGADVASNITPDVDDTYDLGTSTKEWRNLYVDGTANIDTLVIGTSTGVTSVDTDLTSVSASDDTLASAKAIKTYVDAQVTAQDLDFQGDTGGALSIDLDSETLTIAGGTGIDTSGAANTLTVAIDSTVATLTGTQTLTNKTLTSPDVNTPDIDGGTIDGTVIGGTTTAAGSFTTLQADTSLNVDGTVTSDGLTVDNNSTTPVFINRNQAIDGYGIVLNQADTTDGNSLSIAYQTTTTGTVTQNVQFATINFEAETHDWSTRKGNIYFNTTEGGVGTKDRVKIAYNGDVSFYEDTGTTAQLVWDASADALTFGDSVKATFGAGSDLQIYHSGTASIVGDFGTGDLLIRGENLKLQNTAGENYLVATNNDATRLYYDNAEKLATTSSGIDVTGTVTSDGSINSAIAEFNASQSALVSTGSTAKVYATNSTFDGINGSLVLQSRPVAGADVYVATGATPLTVAKFSDGGDISFYEDTGTTAKLFWDASAESLGIGTSSPAEAISVLGNAIFENDTTVTIGYRGTSASTALAFRDRFLGAERMRIDSSGLVGIGTTSIGKTLTVGGTGLRVQSTASADFYSTGQDALIVNNGTANLRFWNNAAERMRIDSSGNVHVGGTTTISNVVSGDNNAPTLIIEDTLATSIALLRQDTSIATSNSFGSYAWYGTATTSNAPLPLAAIQGIASGTHAAGDNPTEIRFLVTADGSETMAEAVRIDDQGNVGIGTSSPDHILCIEGTEPTFRIFDAANTLNQEQTIAFGTEPGNRTHAEIAGINTNTGNAAGALSFKTNSGASLTEAMRVDSSGNVGIGTSSPSSFSGNASNLVVGSGSGTEGMTISSSTTGYGVIYFADGTTGSAAYAGNINYYHADNSMRFGTNGSTTNVVIDSSGNVGINTTNPSAILEVRATAPTYTNNGTVFWGGTTNNDSHNGIMLSSYGDALGGSIGSNLNYSNGTVSQSNINRSSGEIQFGNTTSSGVTSDIKFGGYVKGTTTFTERMRIDSSGNLLVGGTSAFANDTTTINNSGLVYASRGGNKAGHFNRQTSDGEIVVFSKDGTTVGSIAAEGGDALIIQSGTTSGSGLHFHPANAYITPARNGGVVDAALDLGRSNYRFKDLYLSGGVTFGSNIITTGVTTTSNAWKSTSDSTSSSKHMIFANPNGNVGDIRTNASATAYVTSSDYRLKENVEYNFNALERVAQLKPARFNFIADADTIVDGFLAHEVQDIVPEAIYGEKDAVREEEYEITPAVLDGDNNVVTEAVMGIREVPEYQGIDHSKLVPLLTKAIQEQQVLIEQLQAEVALLKGE